MGRVWTVGQDVQECSAMGWMKVRGSLHYFRLWVSIWSSNGQSMSVWSSNGQSMSIWRSNGQSILTDAESVNFVD